MADLVKSADFLDFNPRIPYGMRHAHRNGTVNSNEFQSTHPVWDATRRVGSGQCDHSISIHASRMGCDRHPTAAVRSVLISIHASRMGCDFGLGPVPRLVHISIHASRMGCDPPCRCRTPPSKHFNPRIPYGMRHARKKRVRAARGHFNPRIPYGMRLCGNNLTSLIGISIHASRMGCDVAKRPAIALEYGFQSTHPVWDATLSLHADLRGGVFQSTHPVWDATRNCCLTRFGRLISIHASRMGCDYSARLVASPRSHFNPRIPYGMRLREWTLHSIIWKLLPALRADYIADIPEHLSVCIFGL